MSNPRVDLAAALTEAWDFEDLDASLSRLTALAQSQTDPAHRAIVATQVARACGLLGNPDEARQRLDEAAGADDLEVQARVALERGRLVRSGGDPQAARPEFERAITLTDPVRDDSPLGGLNIDARHMLALTHDPAEQAAITREALALAEVSPDPLARAWLASLLNNLGCALVDTGQLDEALSTFERALAERQRLGQRRNAQIARWMIGWTQRLRGHDDEARAIQLALKDELLRDGIEDEYVSEELALLGVPDA